MSTATDIPASASAIELDMIVGRDRAALPLGILVSLARKPFQHRLVETGEEIVGALLELLHHLRVDLRNAVANGVVQLDQGEETPAAQLAEHEARHDAFQRILAPLQPVRIFAPQSS
jgi:hypothetical protein